MSQANPLEQRCADALAQISDIGSIKERLAAYPDLLSVLFLGAPLAGASFVGQDLRGMDFTGADLEKADFLGARIKGCRFEQANVTLGQLRRAADWSDFLSGWQRRPPRRALPPRPGEPFHHDPAAPNMALMQTSRLDFGPGGVAKSDLLPEEVKALAEGRLAYALRPLSLWQVDYLMQGRGGEAEPGGDLHTASAEIAPSRVKAVLEALGARTGCVYAVPSARLSWVMGERLRVSTHEYVFDPVRQALAVLSPKRKRLHRPKTVVPPQDASGLTLRPILYLPQPA